MFSSPLILLLSCLASAALGYALGHARRPVDGPLPEVEPQPDPVVEDQALAKKKVVDHFVNSIYELTSQVDIQVGQHTSRVNEITKKLDGPNDAGSAMIAVAGKMLVNANHQLQNDLVEAKKEIARQREIMTSCIHESRTDPLTNLANRRGLDHELNRIFAMRRRTGTAFSILIVDIDNFKNVNDSYGHMIGDQLLKSFARRLVDTFRESDFVSRFGGEEFVAILPLTPLDDACRCAERVRSLIADQKFKVGDLELQLTTSIGVKEVQDDESDAELLQKADKALYAAKNGGRNCTYFHDGSMCHRYIPDVPEEIAIQETDSSAIHDPTTDTHPVLSDSESNIAVAGN